MGARPRVFIHRGTWTSTCGAAQDQISSGEKISAAFLRIVTLHENPIHADPEGDYPRNPIQKSLNQGGSLFNVACPIVLPNTCRTRF